MLIVVISEWKNCGWDLFPSFSLCFDFFNLKVNMCYISNQKHFDSNQKKIFSFWRTVKREEVSIVKCCGKFKNGMSHWLRQEGGYWWSFRSCCISVHYSDETWVRNEKMCTAVYRPLAEKRRRLLGFFLVKRQ